MASSIRSGSGSCNLYGVGNIRHPIPIGSSAFQLCRTVTFLDFAVEGLGSDSIELERNFLHFSVNHLGELTRFRIIAVFEVSISDHSPGKVSELIPGVGRGKFDDGLKDVWI